MRCSKRWAAVWGISTAHFGPFADAATSLAAALHRPLDEVLVEHSTYSRSSLKRRLYAAGLKSRAASSAGRARSGAGQRMTLILDHINGVHDDNRLENLQIVCPNCAATLGDALRAQPAAADVPNLRRGVPAPSGGQQYCSLRCWHDSPAFKARRAAVQGVAAERTSNCCADLREMSWVAVGAKYGVSDNAVRKWLRRYEGERAADRDRCDWRPGRASAALWNLAPTASSPLRCRRRMRLRLAAATVAALLLPATAALAGDPDHAARARCTRDAVHRLLRRARDGVSLVRRRGDRRGRRPRDAGAGRGSSSRRRGPRSTRPASGRASPARRSTAPTPRATQRNIGAISESVGEYGGKVALATPIEAILGSPVDAPHARKAARATLARARPLAAPLTVTGPRPRLGNALQQAAAKRGRRCSPRLRARSARSRCRRCGPARRSAVGYASGDITASAIGTVTYTDGDRGLGLRAPARRRRRARAAAPGRLRLPRDQQPDRDRRIAGTYKYAATGHDVGTLTNDTLDAVVGRVGGLPATMPVRVFATDLDTGAKRSVSHERRGRVRRRPADRQLDPLASSPRSR